MPAALMFHSINRLYDGCDKSEPDRVMNGSSSAQASVKVLVGSNSINCMIYKRGNTLDYERLGKDKGMETLNYVHVLPYFKRLENTIDSPNDEFRGHDGAIKLKRGKAVNPLFNELFLVDVITGYSSWLVVSYLY